VKKRNLRYQAGGAADYRRVVKDGFWPMQRGAMRDARQIQAETYQAASNSDHKFLLKNVISPIEMS